MISSVARRRWLAGWLACAGASKRRRGSGAHQVNLPVLSPMSGLFATTIWHRGLLNQLNSRLVSSQLLKRNKTMPTSGYLMKHNSTATSKDTSTLPERVYVSSVLKGLTKALSSRMPNVCFEEIQPDDFAKIENTSKWKDEIMVLDNGLVMPLVNLEPGKIQFIQSTWAGLSPDLTSYLESKPVNPLPFALCRFVHPNMNVFMAEHVLAQVISCERRFQHFFRQQQEGVWKDCNHDMDSRPLNELKIGILGVGNIGKKVAESFKFFGSTTYGLVTKLPKEPSPFIDKYFVKDRLEELLEKCDYICNILPANKDTDNLLNLDNLKYCKRGNGPSATLINVGRANVVSDAAILSALDQDFLHAASLDVFHVEPLPKGHALWGHPKVIVTPHVAGVSRAKDVAESFERNMKVWKNESASVRELLPGLIEFGRSY